MELQLAQVGVCGERKKEKKILAENCDTLVNVLLENNLYIYIYMLRIYSKTKRNETEMKKILFFIFDSFSFM